MSVQRGWRKLSRRLRGAQPLRWRVVACLVAVAALAACNGGGSVNIANSQAVDAATVDYPIFYVKRTVPTDQAGILVQDDLRVMSTALPSADLYMRASASPSAAETNVTAPITASAAASGQFWDVRDVDTSADGTLAIFAMRGPLTPNEDLKKAPGWRIYQYTIATHTLAPVIDPANDPDPPTVDDVSPHYLPDGRIVFSSTRQTQSQGVLLDQGDPQFSAQDEDRTEPAFVLEVMNANGTNIHQISFNQSHDRDATVLANGRVLWSRWDNMPAAGRNQMSLYSANPDGTDLELYYGANSHNTGTNDSVIEFVHPRQMQDGRILAIMRQYTDVDDGGNLVILDGTHYVENTQPLLANRDPHRARADGRHPQRRGDPARALARRALQLRLSAAGRHRPHPRQLEPVPAARHHADSTGHRSVHLGGARRPQSPGGAAALQRMDVRSERRTPCSRSCSRSRA